MEHKVKFIICACNTASAVALDEVAGNYKIEMVGVIRPGAVAAVEKTRNGRIGVIGTNATINSNAYARMIHEINPGLKVFSLPCSSPWPRRGISKKRPPTRSPGIISRR